jgi:hypothetical protein
MTDEQLELIPVRPESDVYGTYRRLAYRAWYAIGEFVDNSTQNFLDFKGELARADGSAWLTIDIIYDPEAGKLTINDNAHGMNTEELSRAVQLNKPPEKRGGRSQYGMGLKMAACWLGSRWTITTKRLGAPVEYEVTLDVEELAKYKPESIAVKARHEVLEQLHYTRIEISGLYRKFRGQAAPRIKEHLSSMYRRDIESGEISIKWNGEPLEWDTDPVWEETLPGGTTKRWLKELDFEIEGLPVRGRVWLRMPGNARRAGLHLFSRNRLVFGGPGEGYKPEDLYHAVNSFQSQRLVGEIDLDDWPVTQTKDAFDWAGDLEQSFIARLYEEIAEYHDMAAAIKAADPTTIPTKADLELAGDATRDSLATSEVDEALVIVDATPPTSLDDSEEAEKVAALAVISGAPTSVPIGSAGLPVLRVFWSTEMPASEIYAYFSSPDDDELNLVVNLNHPFVTTVVRRDPDRLGLWAQLLYVEALVEQAARRRPEPIEARSYRAIRDAFLRRIRAD